MCSLTASISEEDAGVIRLALEEVKRKLVPCSTRFVGILYSMLYVYCVQTWRLVIRDIVFNASTQLDILVGINVEINLIERRASDYLIINHLADIQSSRDR